jgi:deoxycytidylate deaminase
MNYLTKQAKDVLTLANNYAEQNSTCKKTHVGCYIVAEGGWRTVLSKGCNNGEENCKEVGCLREEQFGDNSKEHRKTCRCYGNHAEQDALKKIPDYKRKFLEGASAFVTRYPCEECAKALIEAGIKLVVYGREFPITEETAKLFEEASVEVVHIADWNCDTNDTNN